VDGLIYIYIYIYIGKSEGKFNPRKVHEGSEGEEVQLYSFFNLGSRWRWVANATTGPLDL
jgi:hypothetical protein